MNGSHAVWGSGSPGREVGQYPAYGTAAPAATYSGPTSAPRFGTAPAYGQTYSVSPSSYQGYSGRVQGYAGYAAQGYTPQAVSVGPTSGRIPTPYSPQYANGSTAMSPMAAASTPAQQYPGFNPAASYGRSVQQLQEQLRALEQRNHEMQQRASQLRARLQQDPVASRCAQLEAENAELWRLVSGKLPIREDCVIVRDMEAMASAAPEPGRFRTVRDAIRAPAAAAPVSSGPDPLDFAQSPPPGSVRCLIIGCDYPGQPWALQAGVTDAQQWSRFFVKKGGVDPAAIRFLSDDPSHYQMQPRPEAHVASKDNILRGLQWLSTNVAQGHQVFLVFCGHGAQVLVEEYAGEKLCENCLVPTDIGDVLQQRNTDWRGGSDSDVHQALVRLPRGASVVVIQDACHAGKPLDRCGLDFLTSQVNRGVVDYEKLRTHPVKVRFLDLPKKKLKDNPPDAVRKSVLQSSAVQWAACKNEQFCVELPIEERQRGVFTYVFIAALIECGLHATAETLLQDMQRHLKELKGRGWRLQQDVTVGLGGAASMGLQFMPGRG
mmetsp:Transcript_14150/g.35779  ORF Transcript_14150/g.35779 Transcript_14150/m.35779 type:complete len:548 (+) Transcript_14150:31-1674(+)